LHGNSGGRIVGPTHSARNPKYVAGIDVSDHHLFTVGIDPNDLQVAMQQHEKTVGYLALAECGVAGEKPRYLSSFKDGI
jgi:S-adenosylmethionine:diacylglycerol 3-amino-3-carboxypropyl transferase